LFQEYGGGEITMQLRQEANAIVLSVADRGTGFLTRKAKR